MNNVKLKKGNIVYSKFGVGIIKDCHEGFFGDSETVYEVYYDGFGKKLSRFKEFDEYL